MSRQVEGHLRAKMAARCVSPAAWGGGGFPTRGPLGFSQRQQETCGDPPHPRAVAAILPEADRTWGTPTSPGRCPSSRTNGVPCRHVFVLGVSSMTPWDNPPSLPQNRARASRVARTRGHRELKLHLCGRLGPRMPRFPCHQQARHTERALGFSSGVCEAGELGMSPGCPQSRPTCSVKAGVGAAVGGANTVGSPDWTRELCPGGDGTHPRSKALTSAL